jgi:hypothetical protein
MPTLAEQLEAYRNQPYHFTIDWDTGYGEPVMCNPDGTGRHKFFAAAIRGRRVLMRDAKALSAVLKAGGVPVWPKALRAAATPVQPT